MLKHHHMLGPKDQLVCFKKSLADSADCGRRKIYRAAADLNNTNRENQRGGQHQREPRPLRPLGRPTRTIVKSPLGLLFDSQDRFKSSDIVAGAL